jgi:hypothetical protein
MEGLLADRDYGGVADTCDHSHNKFVCGEDNNSIHESILVHSKRQYV